MTKVQFDIPDNILNEAADKKVKELERKLKNSENKVKRLEAQVKRDQHEREEVVNAVQKLSGVLDDIKFADIFDDLYNL